MQFPLASRRIAINSKEQTLTGAFEYNTSTVATYGKPAPDIGAELLNSVYLGVGYPLGGKESTRVTFGLQLQKQIFTRGSLNYYRIRYYDASGTPRSEERFEGSHTALSLVIGLVF